MPHTFGVAEVGLIADTDPPRGRRKNQYAAVTYMTALTGPTSRRDIHFDVRSGNYGAG